MRRPPAAALTVLILLAGCSTAPDRTATPGPAPAPGGSVAPQSGGTGDTPTGGTGTGNGGTTDGVENGGGTGGVGTGDARLAGNTAAICNQAARTGADFAKTFAANLKLQIDAAANDPAAVQRAEQKSTRDVQNYSYALNDLSKLAADPAVKRALAGMSKQVSALKGDLRKLDAARLAGLRSTLDEACGTA